MEDPFDWDWCFADGELRVESLAHPDIFRVVIGNKGYELNELLNRVADEEMCEKLLQHIVADTVQDPEFYLQPRKG